MEGSAQDLGGLRVGERGRSGGPGVNSGQQRADDDEDRRWEGSGQLIQEEMGDGKRRGVMLMRNADPSEPSRLPKLRRSAYALRLQTA